MNCEKSYISSVLMENILNEIVNGSSIERLLPMYHELWSLPGEPVKPCMKCASCYDYIFFLETLTNVASEPKINRKALKIKLHNWKKTQLNDDVLTGVTKSKKTQFNYELYNTNKKIVYFDQNMLSDYDQKADVYEKVECLKASNNYEFAYSPSHLEEINKIKNKGDISRLLGKITDLTDDLVILPNMNGYYLAKEKPNYSLERVRAFPGSTEAIENLKLVSSEDRKLFLDKYEDEIHKKKIGNNNSIFEKISDESFNELMFYTHSSFKNKDDIKVHRNRGELLHAIYTLFYAFDLLSYKVDSSDRTIRSSVHDIEHIINATRADYFVTKDKKLYNRAKQIYNFLGINVCVLNDKEFFPKLNIKK